jgi:hypothetical protein
MPSWLARLRQRIGRHLIPQSLVSRINAVEAENVARIAALEQDTATRIHALDDAIRWLQQENAWRIEAIDDSRRRIGQNDLLLDEVRRQSEIRTVMDWIAAAALQRRPLISVVLPTRDRCELLARAIRSVEGQTYDNYELLVVDDGSIDATPGDLARLTNRKIRTFRAEGKGVCAARNVALSHATGALIAYLDDDNIMHPQWLKSVAWLFEQRPATQVTYGAIVVDDTARIDPAKSGDLPKLHFWPYARSAVLKVNVADIGCIAHRAGLAEARFDETLREMGDWDVFLRLTREMPPVALPAVACYYTTDSPNRLSFGPTHLADYEKVRAKNPA